MSFARPRAIRLEASSFCQLRCPSCPTTIKAIDPVIGKGFLKLDDFEAVLERNPWIERIELSNYGEIFLNPHLLQILELANRRNVTLSAGNGANLNSVREEVLEGIVKYKLREMTCSIDGASQETYGTYRVRGDFARVIGNIRKINEYKDSHRSRYPRLTWQFVIFGHNEHELPLARQMARELRMDFSPKLTWDADYSPIRDVAFVKRETGLEVTTRDEHEQQFGVDYMQGICHQLWDAPQINWDGKVLGCCRNFWGDFGGNAFTDGLEDSLNTEKISYAREMVLGHEPSRADIPCTTCDIYLSMQKRGQWLNRDAPKAGRTVTAAEALAQSDQFYRLGRLSDAAELCRLVLRADPNHRETLVRLGIIANDLGDADTAIELLSRAVKLKSDNAQAYRTLGEALQRRGRADEAVRCLREAERLGSRAYQREKARMQASKPRT